MEHQNINDYSNINGSNTNVRVFVRARPCANSEDTLGTMFQLFQNQPGKLSIKATNKPSNAEHMFGFDHVYWTDSSQEEIFQSCCKPNIDLALNGINSCCFAYGQTGSGKTFSIFGEERSGTPGILDLSIEYLFESLERKESQQCECQLVMSFLEIYCGQMHDLARPYVDHHNSTATTSILKEGPEWVLQTLPAMSSSASSSSLDIHEDSEGQVYVKNLSRVPVATPKQILKLVEEGLKCRATHATKMNRESSRSHTVISIDVFQRSSRSGLGTTTGKVGTLNLVDLAGSERIKKSEANGQRLKEALHINSSLSAIGKVVMSLDRESGMAYIPYRDSKLTRILQNSIGGNSFTTLLATVHPMTEHYEECLSTLQFATRCRSVQNQPRVNYLTPPGGGGAVEQDMKKRMKKLVEAMLFWKSKAEALEREQVQAIQCVLNEVGIHVTNVSPEGELTLAGGKILSIANVLEKAGIHHEEAAPGNHHHDHSGTDHELLGIGIDSPLSTLSSSNFSTPLLSSRSSDPPTTQNPRRGNQQHHHTGGDVRKTIEGLRHDRHHLKKKLVGLREDASGQHSQLRREVEKLTENLAEVKRQLSDRTQELWEASRRLDQEVEVHREAHRLELDALMKNNTSLLEKQQEQIQSIPSSLRVATTRLRHMAVTEQAASEQISTQVAKAVARLQREKVREVELMEGQFRYWLRKKELDLDHFVSEFNRYRRECATERRTGSDEFAELFQFASVLDQVCQQWLSQVPSLQQWFSQLKNPLRDPEKLKVSKARMASNPQLLKKCTTLSSLFPPAPMTVASETRAKVPTSSSSRRRPGSAPLYRGSMSNPMNFKTDLNTPKKYPSKKMLKKSSQFLTEAEIDQMNEPELRKQLKAQTRDSTTNLLNQDQDQSQTMKSQIQTLEETIKSEQKKYRNLRAAYMAQSRQLHQ